MAGTVRPSVPLSVILAAANGEESALAAVLSHYQGYIRFLSMRPMKDAYGNVFLCVDEDMRRRLETKLLYSIVSLTRMLLGLSS